MKREDLVVFLLDVFEDNDVISYHDAHLKESYLAGTGQILFSELSMDSLAMMEICIAVEINLGVSIVPDQLAQLKSLDELIDCIERLRV